MPISLRKSLVCSMALCLIVTQKHDTTSRMYRFTYFIEFSHFFSTSQWKTKCILEYIRTELNNYYNPESDPMPDRKITIKRSQFQTNIESILKNHKDKRLDSIRVPHDDAVIDDYYEQLKICHTNDIVGGGQYLGGLSQEDILLSAHPQLHCLLVLNEQMNSDECLCLIGFRKYYRIERTRYEIVFEGQDHDYPLTLDQKNRLKDYLAITNCRKFSRENFKEQFRKEPLDRQIAMFYGAIRQFQEIEPKIRFKQVVTGHWGSTLHWGDGRRRLASVWMASAMTQYNCIFCPYGDFNQIYDKNFIHGMKGKSVEDTYQRLSLAGKRMMVFRDSIYVYMLMN